MCFATDLTSNPSQIELVRTCQVGVGASLGRASSYKFALLSSTFVANLVGVRRLVGWGGQGGWGGVGLGGERGGEGWVGRGGWGVNTWMLFLSGQSLSVHTTMHVPAAV